MSDSANYKYAGFWWRVLAYVIDYFILTIAYGLAGAILWSSLGFYGYRAGAIRAIVIIMAPLVGYWLYFALSESSAWRATLGKKICGLIVVGEDGRQISFGRATGRYFSKILSGLILGVGFLMAGWTAKKQALHDKIVDCLVLKQLREPSSVTLPEEDAPTAEPLRIIG